MAKQNGSKNVIPRDRDKQLGLGADVQTMGAAVDLITDALNSPMTTIPVIEHTTLNYSGVLTLAEAQSAFSNTLNFFNDSTGDEADATSTTFVHPGILQNAIIVNAIGFHVFAEPLCWTQIGNSLSPVPVGAQLSPMSPDVFSQNATLANLGLVSPQTLTPAAISWGWPMQYAAWNLIEGYMFEWVVRQRYDLLRESARYIAHFGSFSDKVGAGTSQVPVTPFARVINNRYRTKGSTGIVLPIDHVRQGLFAQGGEIQADGDTFRPSSDFQLADVTWGGLALQDQYRNQPWRRLPTPYCIMSGMPLGLRLVSTGGDQIHINNLIALMSASGGLTQDFGATPPVITADQQITPGFNIAGSGPEVSLDLTPAIFPSQTNVARALYKGGNLSLSMMIKGWEVTDDLLQQICSDPALKAKLTQANGLQIAA
jgi:hypothetical protein